MYQVKEFKGFDFEILAEKATVAEAIAAVRGKIFDVQEDEAHPDHYDVITWQGDVFAIEPTKKKAGNLWYTR